MEKILYMKCLMNFLGFPLNNNTLLGEGSLQGEHIVVEVFTETPRKIYPFFFYSEGC
jgi:hypothetical protein